MFVRKEQIKKKRLVLECIIDIIKVTGKRGHSYRVGLDSEAAYKLEDTTADHGIFLELILQLSKYDVCLKEHLNHCTKKN